MNVDDVDDSDSDVDIDGKYMNNRNGEVDSFY